MRHVCFRLEPDMLNKNIEQCVRIAVESSAQSNQNSETEQPTPNLTYIYEKQNPN